MFGWMSSGYSRLKCNDNNVELGNVWLVVAIIPVAPLEQMKPWRYCFYSHYWAWRGRRCIAGNSRPRQTRLTASCGRGWSRKLIPPECVKVANMNRYRFPQEACKSCQEDGSCAIDQRLLGRATRQWGSLPSQSDVIYYSCFSRPLEVASGTKYIKQQGN